MIRYFCDRCNSEVPAASNLNEVTLPNIPNHYKYQYELTKYICNTCALLFRDLMENKNG